MKFLLLIRHGESYKGETGNLTANGEIQAKNTGNLLGAIPVIVFSKDIKSKATATWLLSDSKIPTLDLNEAYQGEEQSSIFERVFRVLKLVQNLHKAHDLVALVSHDTFMRYLVGTIIEKEPDELQPLNHCSITKLVIERNTVRVDYYNLADHLKSVTLLNI